MHTDFPLQLIRSSTHGNQAVCQISWPNIKQVLPIFCSQSCYSKKKRLSLKRAELVQLGTEFPQMFIIEFPQKLIIEFPQKLFMSSTCFKQAI